MDALLELKEKLKEFNHECKIEMDEYEEITIIIEDEENKPFIKVYLQKQLGLLHTIYTFNASKYEPDDFFEELFDYMQMEVSSISPNGVVEFEPSIAEKKKKVEQYLLNAIEKFAVEEKKAVIFATTNTNSKTLEDNNYELVGKTITREKFSFIPESFGRDLVKILDLEVAERCFLKI